MTTVNIQTIGTGKTHATLSDFATWLHTRDLVANDERVEGHVYESLSSGINWVDLYSATYDATRYTTVRPAPGLSVSDLESNSGALDYGTQGIEISKNCTAPLYIRQGVVVEGFRINLDGSVADADGGMMVARGETQSVVVPATLRHNRIKFTGSNSAATGIKTGEFAGYSMIAENVFFCEASAGNVLRTHYNATAEMNTFIGRGSGAGISPHLNTAPDGVTVRYNAYYGCGAVPMTRQENPATCVGNYTDAAITGTSTGFTVATPLITSTTDARPAAGSVLIGAAPASYQNTNDVRGNFRGSSPDIGAAMRTAAAIPSAPVVTVTSVQVIGQKVKIDGTFTGVATSGTANISPATTPNGAVAASSAVTIGSGTFSATISGVAPGNYDPVSVSLGNAGGTGTDTSDAGFTIAIQAVPTITITGQSKSGQNVTITGTTTGYPQSGTVSLPAAITPNGAVTATGNLTFNDSNQTFSVALTGVAYGNYAGPTVTATNMSGSDTDVGQPMSLYAPGTQPQGLPAVVLPAYSVPIFNSPAVAVGGIITDATLQSTSGSAQANLPFTFGHAFKRGDLAPSNFIVGKVSGESDIPLQFNVMATHPDGSVRHAIISGVLPALGANASKVMSLARASASTADTTPLAASVVVQSAESVVADIYVSGTTHYSATLSGSALGGVANQRWVGGSLVNEYIFSVPFKDDSNVDHTQLTAQFSVRRYVGTTTTKIDVSIEHTKAYAANTSVPYNGTISIDGAQVHTFTAVTHRAATRWKKQLWRGTQPALHIKHNTAYLIGSKQVPNYDQTVVMEETTLAGYASSLGSADFGPMGFGVFQPSMGTTGGRPDVGLMPDTYAAALLSTDKRAKNIMLASGDVGGSWGAHRRDTSTDADAPGKGRPISVINYPYATILGQTGDATNPSTSVNEKFPTFDNNLDSSHQPNFAYLPYLLTGDFYYLEELHFYVTYNIYQANPEYRSFHQGLMSWDQLRGQGWTMRTLAEAAVITPDNHPDKPQFRYWLDSNLAYYNTNYTDNSSATPLGIVTNGSTIEYTIDGVASVGIAPWQDDHFTSSMGHVNELGFTEAGRLVLWKAKFQIGRLLASGVCYIDSCTYALRIRDTIASSFYTTLAQAFNATLPTALTSLSCNSQARLDYMNANRALPSNAYVLNEILGYADGTQGYPSNFQPALAMAVDSGYTNADLAWDLFANRAVKPNYGTGPQFAVVPRIVASAPATTVPGAPTIGTATAGNGSASVTFTAPASDGGAAITGYTATSTPGSFTGTGASSPIAVSGLTNGTAYTFTVHATNSVGNSAESAASNSVTPAAPVKTVTLTVVADDGLGTPMPSLTGIKWWSRDDPAGAATDFGTAESTDGSGVMVIQLPNSTKTSGQLVRIDYESADGTRSWVGNVVVD